MTGKSEVDTLLAKYGEKKLLGMVRKKYNVTPDDVGSPPAGATVRSQPQKAPRSPSSVNKPQRTQPRQQKPNQTQHSLTKHIF